METHKKKGILFIIAGVASFFLLPIVFMLISNLIGIYIGFYYVHWVVAIILIGLGIKKIVEHNKTLTTPTTLTEHTHNNFNIENMAANKIINVTFTGGIIGFFLDSPKNKLNRIVKKENQNGMRVVQVIPAESGNIFLILFRLIILLMTFFLYTPVNGYYVIMEKKV